LCVAATDLVVGVFHRIAAEKRLQLPAAPLPPIPKFGPKIDLGQRLGRDHQDTVSQVWVVALGPRVASKEKGDHVRVDDDERRSEQRSCENGGSFHGTYFDPSGMRTGSLRDLR